MEPPEAFPNPPRELTVEQAVELALSIQKRGRLDAAEEIYRRVLEAVPDHVDALHFLGIARHHRGERDEGLALVRRALELAPDNVEARNNLGNMLSSRGRLEDAEAAFRQVLESAPDHVHALANLGSVLRRRGDLVGAEAALRRAIALAPNRGEAYHNLINVLHDLERDDEALDMSKKALEVIHADAEAHRYGPEAYRAVGALLYANGRVSEALEVYQRWLQIEPNSDSARHMIASCAGAPPPARAADDFVRLTFANFAERFDTILTQLDYRAPALVALAVRTLAGQPARALAVLDAGVGTGWCGADLHPFARTLVGVDLSPEMLAKARERQIDDRPTYDELVEGELTAFMRARPRAFDLIVSADTLVYFGPLEEVLGAAAGALRPGGHIVFTVEQAPDDASDGFRLNPHGRYSHAEAYLRRTLAAAGFAEPLIDRVVLRQELKVPVAGYLITARLAAPAS
jgi:predicted TPR repeat methyltransferase